MKVEDREVMDHEPIRQPADVDLLDLLKLDFFFDQLRRHFSLNLNLNSTCPV